MMRLAAVARGRFGLASLCLTRIIPKRRFKRSELDLKGNDVELSEIADALIRVWESSGAIVYENTDGSVDIEFFSGTRELNAEWEKVLYAVSMYGVDDED